MKPIYPTTNWQSLKANIKLMNNNAMNIYSHSLPVTTLTEVNENIIVYYSATIIYDYLRNIYL